MRHVDRGDVSKLYFTILGLSLLTYIIHARRSYYENQKQIKSEGPGTR